jgi:hypothetical protein
MSRGECLKSTLLGHSAFALGMALPPDAVTRAAGADAPLTDLPSVRSAGLRKGGERRIGTAQRLRHMSYGDTD